MRKITSLTLSIFIVLLFTAYASAKSYEIEIQNNSDKRCEVDVKENHLFYNKLALTVNVPPKSTAKATLSSGYCPSCATVRYYNADNSIHKSEDVPTGTCAAKCWNIFTRIQDWYMTYWDTYR